MYIVLPKKRFLLAKQEHLHSSWPRFVCGLTLAGSVYIPSCCRLQQDRSSQESRQTRPAGGVAAMLLITPIARGFFLFCSRLPCHVHEAAASDKETVAELRANVCLIFDRDIVITSAGRGRTAWAELKMQHVLAARPVVDVATPPQSDIN